MIRRSLCLMIAVVTFGCSDIPTNHDTEEECGCVSEAVRVGPVDGPVQSLTTIAPCRSFSLVVEAIADRPKTSCQMPMICPAVANYVTGKDVERAAQNPEVQAALRAGPSRYGRPDVAGANVLYRIGVGAYEVEVGAECGDAPDCTPVPPSLIALVELMNKISLQELKRSPCREDLSPSGT